MNLHVLDAFLDGGRVVLELMVALLFARLRRTTGDRLYTAFTAAFGLLALGDAFIGLDRGAGEVSALVFVPRLLAFVTIIAAIVDKNRRSRRAATAEPPRSESARLR